MQLGLQRRLDKFDGGAAVAHIARKRPKEACLSAAFSTPQPALVSCSFTRRAQGRHAPIPESNCRA
ncbi:MAG: hypothetical protein ABL933_02490, partial [Methyloglobulus sp.]